MEVFSDGDVTGCTRIYIMITSLGAVSTVERKFGTEAIGGTSVSCTMYMKYS